MFSVASQPLSDQWWHVCLLKHEWLAGLCPSSLPLLLSQLEEVRGGHLISSHHVLISQLAWTIYDNVDGVEEGMGGEAISSQCVVMCSDVGETHIAINMWQKQQAAAEAVWQYGLKQLSVSFLLSSVALSSWHSRRCNLQCMPSCGIHLSPRASRPRYGGIYSNTYAIHRHHGG